MSKSLWSTLDLLTLQTSLVQLEECFVNLRAETEVRLEALDAECESLAKEKEEAQRMVAELKHLVSATTAELAAEREEREAGAERLNALEGELAGVKGERDAQEKEKFEAQEKANELKTELESERSEGEARAERLNALEGELAGVKGERDALVEEAELTLFQLHQVQKELKHYYYQARGKNELLKKHQAQQQRIKKLVSDLLTRS